MNSTEFINESLDTDNLVETKQRPKLIEFLSRDLSGDSVAATPLKSVLELRRKSISFCHSTESSLNLKHIELRSTI